MSLSESDEDSARHGDDPEHDEFIQKLQQHHDERGTVLESAPKVGSKVVDLLKLYKRVTSEGGYDVVSDTKSNKLMWRKIGQDFHLGNSPTLAFTLKTVYYKNLAAYEIKNFHNKEPPPKEILEETTAKGADLLNRTTENYTKPLTKEERLAEAAGVDGTNGEQQTPGKENMDQDETGNMTGRATRGLRQAPPPRQLFQGEVTTPRSTRQVSKEASSPVPSANPYASTNNVFVPNGVPQSLAAYEPRPQLPAQLRPVMTPGNNFEKFKEEQKRIRDARAAYLRGDLAKHRPTPGLLPPGTGFQGPTIYTRTIQSLRSGILEEQEYALYHLTKISHERGERFRFDHFVGLAEALVEKVLEVGALILDVKWQIVFHRATSGDPERVYDHKNSSTDVVSSIEFSRKRKRNDNLESTDFSRRICLVNEAALILRNMTIMDHNADFLSRFPTTRALLIILLSLPQQANTVELQQYGLDMAEQLTKYCVPQENDQLFNSLIQFLNGNDRGMILSAIRAICRLGIMSQQAPPLQDIPSRVVKRLTSWMMVEDEELRGAALDLLYQYTVRPDNVHTLIDNADIGSFVRQLVRLLLHGARYEERKEESSSPAAPVHVQQSTGTTSALHPTQDIPIPRISQDHVESLLAYNEPDRSTQWLKACFEEDGEGEITQIALWQAYQIPFAPYASTHPLLPAKDFITNVSNTFEKASAQVMPSDNGQPRFVIKGIKARRVPVDPKGRAFLRCLWKDDIEKLQVDETGAGDATQSTECAVFARDAKAMWEHIVTTHLGLARNAEDNNRFDFTSKPGVSYSCHWAGCKRFAATNYDKTSLNPYVIGMHVKTHLPDTSEKAFQKSKHNQESKQEAGEGAHDDFFSHASRTFQSQNTAVDERSEATGLPLISCLVLRNLAKNLPKAVEIGGGEDVINEGDDSPPTKDTDKSTAQKLPSSRNGQELVGLCFSGVKDQLFAVMALNQSLKDHLPSLLQAIEDSGG